MAGPDLPHPDDPPASADHAAVREVNQRFYAAFEAQDLDAMSDLWEHTDRATCTHPGWRTLRGWAQVSASWYALFNGSAPVQFILTDERIEVTGDVAWVTVDENLISDRVGGTVAALNLFERSGDGWRLLLHHGSPVTRTPEPREQAP